MSEITTAGHGAGLREEDLFLAKVVAQSIMARGRKAVETILGEVEAGQPVSLRVIVGAKARDLGLVITQSARVW